MPNSTKQNENTSLNQSTPTQNQRTPMPGSQFDIYKPQSTPTPAMEGFNPSNRIAVYDSVDEK